MTLSEAEIDYVSRNRDRVVHQPDRIRSLRTMLFTAVNRLDPIVEVLRPFVDGLSELPRDGRFLLVGNHTVFGLAEVLMIPYFVHRELGVRVRGLADRRALLGMRGPAADLFSAAGAVLGNPDIAAELMRHDETVLVFPGGGREMLKFKGEEYQLLWEGRRGFARLAIAHGYPIVPVGLVGGDDVYKILSHRDSGWARASQAFGARFLGSPDAVPLRRGIGPTLIPRPQRMYLRFGAPIDTVRPARTASAAWQDAVRDRTRTALEVVLCDLQSIRADDPYRALNPLGWRRAVQPGNSSL